MHFCARLFRRLQKDRLARTMPTGLRRFSGSVRDTPGPITKNNVPEEFFAPLKGEAFTLLYDIEGNNPYESNAMIVVGAARLS